MEEEHPSSGLDVSRQELEKPGPAETQGAGALPESGTPGPGEENQNHTTDDQEAKGEAEAQPPDDHGEGEALKGRKVSKRFGRKYFSGEVVSFDPETHWYKVAYEDGDEEELWWWELEPLLLRPRSTARKSRVEAEQKTQRRRTSREKDSSEAEVSTPKETHVSQASEEATPRKRGKVREGSVHSKSSLEEAPIDTVAETQRTLLSESIEERGLGVHLLGRETRKNFDGKTCHGKVVGFDPKAKLYKVSYEGGDEEQLKWTELLPILLSLNEKTITISNGHAGTEPEHEDDPQANPDKATPERDKTEPENIETRKHSEQAVAVLPSPSPSPAACRGSRSFHAALHASRFASSESASDMEYFAWGEVVAFDRIKCPVLQAVKMLPTSSPIVHLAASRHHLAALTAAGQVFVWRNKHENIQERTNQWEHIWDLDNKSIVLIEIAGPELNRSAAGYTPDQEDQIPDPFYLVAISYSGKDYVLQGSRPQEPVHTCSLAGEPRLLDLETLLKLNDSSVKDLGRIVQVSLGTVGEFDEPPFIGYITDSDHVFMRSASRNYTEEVYDVTGFTGKPRKIQCGKACHAVLLTDNGCAWTWGMTASSRDLSVCSPVLDGQKVIDVGCFGDDFIALTEDGYVHQWTHGGNKFVLMISPEDKLRRVMIGHDLSAGLSATGKLHTWRMFARKTKALKTPLGRDEESKNTAVSVLGKRTIQSCMCVAGSLVVVAKKLKRGRPARKTSGKG